MAIPAGCRMEAAASRASIMDVFLVKDWGELEKQTSQCGVFFGVLVMSTAEWACGKRILSVVRSSRDKILQPANSSASRSGSQPCRNKHDAASQCGIVAVFL